MKVLAVYAAAVEGRALDPSFGAMHLGVGKVAAATALAAHLATRPAIDGVLLFGICGAYPGAGLEVLDGCMVVDDVLADDGVLTEERFLDLDALRLGSNGPFAADRQLTDRVAALLDALPRVRGATVSTCSGTDELAQRLARRTGAAVESMEGAAVAFVCRQFGLPMAQLRYVSNRCGARPSGGFDIAGACARAQLAVSRVLRGLR